MQKNARYGETKAIRSITERVANNLSNKIET